MKCEFTKYIHNLTVFILFQKCLAGSDFQKEEVFLYSVIFESQIEKSDFFEINFDKIVKLASKHLLLPFTLFKT